MSGLPAAKIEIVRNLGVFRRYGTVVGAICVGFVHHAFYEIFDHLGPQLRWWEWTLDHPMNQPFFDSVPLPSVVVFAALWPMSLALCVQFFVGRHVDGGRSFTGTQVVLRTIVIGVLASIGTAILPLPATAAAASAQSRASLVGVNRNRPPCTIMTLSARTSPSRTRSHPSASNRS